MIDKIDAAFRAQEVAAQQTPGNTLEQREFNAIETLNDDIRNQPSVYESMKAGISLAPLINSAVAGWNTWFMDGDPEFNPARAVDLARKTHGITDTEMLHGADSQAEFDYLLQEQLSQEQDALIASTTMVGKGAMFASSMVSMENAIFSLATAGTGTFGVVAKSAANGVIANTIRTARYQNALRVGTAGAISSAAGTMVDANYNVGISEEDIVMSGLLGFGIGAPLGGVYGRIYKDVRPPSAAKSAMFRSIGGEFYETLQRLHQRISRETLNSYTKTHAEREARKAMTQQEIDAKKLEVNQYAIKNHEFRTQDGKLNLSDEAIADWHTKNQMDARKATLSDLEEAVAKYSPNIVRSEREKFLMSKSPLAQMIGVLLPESGTGSIVKNDTASVIMHQTQDKLGWHYNMPVRLATRQFIREKQLARAKGGKQDFAATVARHFDNARNHMDDLEDFNRQFLLYQNHKYSGAPKPAVSPVIEELHEIIEKGNKLGFNTAREAGVHGFDDITYKPGYVPMRHHPDKYRRMISVAGKDAVVELVQKAAMSKTGGMGLDAAKAKKVARAFVNRFSKSEFDVRSTSVLDNEAWEMLEDILKSEGIDPSVNLKEAFTAEATRTGVDASRFKHARHRVPLDMSVKVGDFSMLDLIDTNVAGLYTNYAMSMGGQIGLAKAGIPDMRTLREIGDKILQQDPNLKDAVEDLINTFATGREGGGVKFGIVAKAQKLAVLSMLNTLGAPQLAESGTLVTAMGARNFAMRSGGVFKNMWLGKTTEDTTRAAKEFLEHFGRPIGQDHKIFMPSLNAEMTAKHSLYDRGLMEQLSNALDNGINLGLDLQGYTSGFNVVRSMEQQVAFAGLIDKISDYAKNAKALDVELANLGMSEELWFKVRSEVQKHAVYKDGKIDMFNYEKWNPDTADQLSYLVIRNQNNLVQKAMYGEGSAWLGKDTGSMLLQFRKFPLDSLRKQAVRKMNISQQHFGMSAAYNTMIAAMVITARNYLTGGNMDVTLEDVIRNGIVYNADLGAPAMLWDLGISLTGAPDALHINPYATYGDGIFSVPALHSANRLANIGATATDAIDGELDGDSYRTLRALPIIGNHLIIGQFMRPD